MITISIDDEVNTHFEAESLLEEVLRQVRNGNTSGVYPNWSLDGEEEPEEDEDRPCPHEDNITYGKAIKINKLNRVLQVFCETCESYGTIYEKRDKHTTDDDYYQVKEVWHELKDYRRVD